MKRSRGVGRSGRTRVGSWGLLLAIAVSVPAVALADPAFNINGRALAKFAYDGAALPTNLADFKQQFPQAKAVEWASKREQDATNPDPHSVKTGDRSQAQETRGLETFEVENYPNADLARFYFCDGRLYQFEAQYNRERLQKQGGIQALLRKLIQQWGPVDHAGESRWTWQRPMYSRRADFYSWPDRAQLTISDTAWLPVVTERRTGKLTIPESIGF